jgi:hypothetical protein
VASASSRAAEKPTAVVSAVRHPPGVTATVERSSIDMAFPTISAALRGPSMPIRAPTTIPRAGFTTINHSPMPVPPPMRYIRHPTNGLVVGPVTVTPQIAPPHMAVNNVQSVSNVVHMGALLQQPQMNPQLAAGSPREQMKNQQTPFLMAVQRLFANNRQMPLRDIRDSLLREFPGQQSAVNQLFVRACQIMQSPNVRNTSNATRHL